jgi:gliding motility-associated-like protein
VDSRCRPIFVPGQAILPHNVQWVGFVAGSTNITMEITPSACSLGNNNGLQVGIWGTTDCNSFSLASNCVYQAPPNQPTTLTLTGLTVGGTYFFVVDGHSDDVCQFTVNVTSGTTVAPPVTAAPTINAPSGLYCPGGTYTFSSSSVANAGVYNWTLDGVNVGSDQTVTITLPPNPTGTYNLCVTPSNTCHGDGPPQCISIPVTPLPTDVLTENICPGQSVNVYGNNYSVPGNYPFDATLPSGCVQPVDLTVIGRPDYDITLPPFDICIGESVTVGGQVFSISGSYSVMLQTPFGCDSIINFDVEAHFPDLTLLDEEICSTSGGYTIGNQTYNTSSPPGNPYIVVLPNQYGCDSTVALNLTVYTPQTLTIRDTICQGEFYQLGNVFYNASGVYQDNVVGPGGCMNNTTLQLTVSNPTRTLNQTICNGQSVTVGGTSYNTSGTYTRVLQDASSLGCDSTVILNLTVRPPITRTLSPTVCASDGFTVGANTYFNPGTYVNVLTASNGCDSTVTLNLSTWPEPTTNLNVTICAEDSYTFGATTYNTSGTYQQVFNSVNGCDSTVNLNLTVRQAIATTLNPSICDGESFSVGGNSYTAAGTYTNVLTAANGCDSTVTLNLTILNVPVTNITTTICFGDSYTVGTSNYTASGMYSDTLVAANGCDSIVNLNLTIRNSIETTLNVEICSGQTYTLGSNTYDMAGSYQAVFSSVATGCDSTVFLNLSLTDLLTDTLDVSICNGESYMVGANSYTTTGTYENFYVTPAGCDSLFVLNLTVLPTPQTTLTEIICNGESFSVGTSTYTVSGIYTDVLTAANSCDSTVTLNLTVLPTPQTTLTISICDDESYTVGTSTYTMPGTYTDVLTAANGCDSTVTLNLTVLPTPETILTESICNGESFTVGTSTYSATGVYTDILTAANGCDSTVTLNLTVLPTPQTTLTEAICAGETFSVGTSNYTMSGTYTDVLTAANGCDSTVTLNLTVHPIPVTNIVTSVCTGASYTVGTSVYTVGGSYSDTLVAVTGCDSIVNLVLTITSFYENNLTRSICEGESVTIGSSTYTLSGTYQDVFIAQDGCDSIVNLALTVFPIPVTNLVQVICAGESFSVGTSTYINTGMYQDVLTAVTGCDSIVNLSLTVNPNFNTILTEAICDGESFTVGTSTYTVSGVYTDVLTASNNCDSTVTLNLTVHPIPMTNLTEIICAGETFTVGTSTFSTTGTFQTILAAATGCDSIVNLNLTVRAPIATTLNRAICDGESFTVGTSSYTTSGTFTDVLTSVTGCDSTVTLNLTVHPIPMTNLVRTICAGESFTVGTSTFSTTGTFQTILTAATGCDSIVTLNLTVRAPITTTLTEAICSGESFAVGTSTYTSSGIFTDVLTSVTGCDSTVTLNLTVHPIPMTNLVRTICAGESFTVGTSTFSTTGTFQTILTAATGCDSIVNLNLTVRAPIATTLNRAICQGQSFAVGTSTYTNAGTFTDVLTSVTGCDSTVTLNLTVNPVYEITLTERICDDQTFSVGNMNFSATGTYQVRLSSVAGCDSIVNLILTAHPCTLQFTSNAGAANCFGASTGSVQFSMTVGTPPYAYQWQAVGGTLNGNGTLATNNSPVNLPNLPAGSYRIVVTDFYGITQTINAAVTQPSPVTVSLAGSNYNGFNVSCPGATDGEVTVTVNGGNAPYSYLWSTGSTQTALRNVPVGQYQLTLTDANGCTSTPAVPSIVLNGPPPIVVSATATDPPCFGQVQGSISIDNVTGGVGPYLYAIDNDPFSSRSLYGGLPVGPYIVRVQDANGCTQQTSVTVNQPQELIVDLGDDLSIKLGEDIQLEALASYQVETYSWQGDSLSCYDCFDPTARPFSTATYSVTVTDRNGCTDSDMITVFVDKARDVFFPTAFSPNDDGVNDRFYPFSGNNVAVVRSFYVFNRWGESMFELFNFQANNPSYGWDGTHRAQGLNTGVYVFVAEVEFIDGEVVIFKGDVTLIR